MQLKKLFLVSLIVVLAVSCSSDSENPVFEGDLVISTLDQYNRFNYVHVFGKLIIENLETEDLAKLNRLTSVGGLIIRNNSMTSLNGLSNLEIIGGDLILEGNENLTELCCLNQVTHVESLRILNHPSLVSISGLSGLQTVNDTLKIEVAQQLVSLNGLQNMTRVNAPMYLNFSGVNTLDGLQGLNQVRSLYLEHLDLLTSAVELTSLETIIDDLVISDCNQLTQIATPNLQTVSSILVGVQPSLVEANFGNVQNNLDFVSIADAPNLELLRGLENVAEMGQLDLTDLSSLQDLNGFTGLTKVIGNLRLNNLSSLTTLEGLENLQSAATQYEGNPANYTRFTIAGLNTITSLFGLSQLETTGQIMINNNDNLSSLDGTNLQFPIPIGSRMFIENNLQLTNYCGFSDFVNNGNINAALIENNAYNPTLPQIGSQSDCSL